MTEQIKMWRERWLDSINELTSFDLQRKSWLDITTRSPHWSFNEFMCCYFDDLDIKDNYSYYIDNGWISKQEYEIIKDWHELLDKYEAPHNEYYNPYSILSDTKWFDILKAGENAKNKLAEILSVDERQYLMTKKNHLKYT